MNRFTKLLPIVPYLLEPALGQHHRTANEQQLGYHLWYLQPNLADDGAPRWPDPPATYSYASVASGNAFIIPNGGRS